MWIEGLMKQSQAQAEVLQQHQVWQQVIAEVIKSMMHEQPRRQQQANQNVTGTGPTVTEVDDESGMSQDFQRGPNPHVRPPDREMTVVEMPLPWAPFKAPSGMQF